MLDMSEHSRPPGAPRRRRRKPTPSPARTPAETSTITIDPTPTSPPPSSTSVYRPRSTWVSAAAGFTAPFAIQTKAIPVALTGRDVCGRAKTGSGKTLAFGVPMLARLVGRSRRSPPAGHGPRADPRVGPAGRRGARTRRRRLQSHRARRVRRCLAPSADRRAESRCRRDRRDAAAADRPAEGERARPQQGRDRRARRGRPHGRRRLHPAGRMDPAQGHRRRTRRCCSRRRSTAMSATSCGGT